MKKIMPALGAALLLAGLAASPAMAKDYDNNPPGPAGGPGTNWENPRGPVGGPGASPHRRPWRYAVTYRHGGWWYYYPAYRCWWTDPDWNPPGPAGGPGTNWENPPGPVGGPGASPDRWYTCR
ncbi:MAG: hypothetical protein HXY22_02770 [Alphaproteobacteria bacterium]|nr:hypothetical protein [Alphaproteobacteria bacterium]